MNPRLYTLIFTLLLGTCLLVGCSSGEKATSTPQATAIQSQEVKPTAPLNVTVSILPQTYFVKRIGGEHVDVNVMVQPGDSPATYEPKPAQLTALSKADAYVSIGVPFESVWLDKIAAANENMRLVDTTQGIEKMGQDPHIWLSPELVKIQSQTIYEALSELDPAHEAEFKANLDAFTADIEELQADIKETLTGLKSTKFMVFHPAWGYFGREFGLEQIPIEIGGQEPSAAELADLIKTAQQGGIQVIFAQPEFSTENAQTIANEIGGEVLLISTLDSDWLTNMRHVAETFAEILSQ